MYVVPACDYVAVPACFVTVPEHYALYAVPASCYAVPSLTYLAIDTNYSITCNELRVPYYMYYLPNYICAVNKASLQLVSLVECSRTT